MNKPAKPVRVPTPTKPHVPISIPPHGETLSGNPRQIHSTPPPPPSKK